ncbi:MAG: hypothetical protein R3E10_15915 [Gemmatimonadota bacterium]
MDCSNCGVEFQGRYCPTCGLDRVGSPTAALFSLGVALLGGVTLLMTMLALGLPRILAPTPPPEAGSGPTASEAELGAAPWVDLTQISPQEAADRLFVRVMRAARAGDQAEVVNFLPMAVGAFEMLDPLGPGDAFRLALLQQVGGAFDASYQTMIKGLEEEPAHLLLLGGAAELAWAMGDADSARGYARRMLNAYDGELAKRRAEYDRSSDVLSTMRTRALQITGEDSAGV